MHDEGLDVRAKLPCGHMKWIALMRVGIDLHQLLDNRSLKGFRRREETQIGYISRHFSKPRGIVESLREYENKLCRRVDVHFTINIWIPIVKTPHAIIKILRLTIKILEQMNRRSSNASHQNAPLSTRPKLQMGWGHSSEADIQDKLGKFL